MDIKFKKIKLEARSLVV